MIVYFQKNVFIALLLIVLLTAVNLSIRAAVIPEILEDKSVSQCLQYEPVEVSLNGQVVRSAFVNASGKKEIVWLLKLDQPICVDSAGPDSINQKAENVTRLQLVLNPNDYQTYHKYLSKKVLARGTLFYGHTQHHFTDVLLSLTKIRLNSSAALLQ